MRFPKLRISCLTLALCLGPSLSADSQIRPLQSQIDDLLTIETITILPFADNTQGIYSRPLETRVSDQLRSLHRWTFLPSSTQGPYRTSEELDQDPELVRQLADSIEADAFILGSISRGNEGIALQLDLYLKRDAQLFVRVDTRGFERSDLESVGREMDRLLARMIRQIPYEGRILSRQGQRVTLNLGQRDNVSIDQEVSVVQIISAQRHPHFNFVVNTEKTTLGKVKLLKVDETLSFGIVVSEKEPGAIQKNSKISGLSPVTYPDPTIEPLVRRQDAELAFGDDPVAWVPKRPPTFGQVGGFLGFGQFNQNLSVPDLGVLESKDKLFPSLSVSAELWLTSNWSVLGSLEQSIVSFSNPLSGSSPENLNQQVSSYELLFGYNFRANYDIWGPQAHILLGYGSKHLRVDNSEPLSFTSRLYYGPLVTLRGSFPILPDQSLGAGAELSLYLRPKLSEQPLTSGASHSNKINEFSAFLYQRYSEHIRLQLNLDFELYSTQFSGAGTRPDSATSSSHRSSKISVGVYYLF